MATDQHRDRMDEGATGLRVINIALVLHSTCLCYATASQATTLRMQIEADTHW
jgi:hypothetical protein